MIQALQITPEILTSNIDNINFDTVDLRSRSANCCGWLQYMNGGSDFTIIGGGTFKISFNANAVNRYTDDCVIRAISCATGKSWDYVYDYLSDIAQYEGTLFDKKDFVINYLDRTYKRLYDVYGTVGHVSALFPNNTILITMNGHITCSKDGVIYDTFDCRDKEAEFVWLIS